jgi:endonuclease YncB( thermonuclease family)
MKESFKENLLPTIFIVIVLILTAISAYPQRKLSGKVTEIIDGKTVVVEIPNGKVTVVLPYIEIPEPEQPLYKAVKDHLQALVLNKTVEFMPRGVVKDKTFGKLFVKGVDVSQQMIRDGAAWYSVPEKSSQDEAESLLYQSNETQARNEKLGIWGAVNLKPSWEFRAEQAALQKQKEQEAYKNAALVREAQREKKRLAQQQQRQQNAPQIEMWADVGGGSQYDQPLGVGGLRTGYDPTKGVGHISTPSIFLDFPKTDFVKFESRLFYIYKGDKTRIEDSVYAIAFLSTSKEYKFIKSNNLTITADKEKLNLGKAMRFYRQNGSVLQELLVYKITRAQVMKLVKSQKILVQIANYSGGISAESLAYINNLLNAS